MKPTIDLEEIYIGVLKRNCKLFGWFFGEDSGIYRVDITEDDNGQTYTVQLRENRTCRQVNTTQSKTFI